MFAIGIAAGGFIANHLLSAEPVEFLPDSFMSVGGGIRLLVGGILIGFGTRYAGGCTSGHAITGISNLNWPSLCGDDLLFRRRLGCDLGTWKRHLLGGEDHGNNN